MSKCDDCKRKLINTDEVWDITHTYSVPSQKVITSTSEVYCGDCCPKHWKREECIKKQAEIDRLESKMDSQEQFSNQMLRDSYAIAQIKINSYKDSIDKCNEAPYSYIHCHEHKRLEAENATLKARINEIDNAIHTLDGYFYSPDAAIRYWDVLLKIRDLLEKS